MFFPGVMFFHFWFIGVWDSPLGGWAQHGRNGSLVNWPTVIVGSSPRVVGTPSRWPFLWLINGGS